MASLLICGAAGANDLTYFDTVFDTDWASAGVGGRRGDGTGPITRAYLYWNGPTNSTNPLANAPVTFGGTAINGSNIGFSDDNFLKADVAEINDASLVVFFNDGNDANFANEFDALGWNTTLSGINYSIGTASIQRHVSDGQDFAGADDGNLRINGTTVANGDIFNGKLWDINSFAATTFLTPGTNSLNVQLDRVNDALSPMLAAIDLPAGAAPVVPAIPELQTYVRMLLGLGAVTGAARKRRLGQSV